MDLRTRTVDQFHDTLAVGHAETTTLPITVASDDHVRPSSDYRVRWVRRPDDRAGADVHRSRVVVDHRPAREIHRGCTRVVDLDPFPGRPIRRSDRARLRLSSGVHVQFREADAPTARCRARTRFSGFSWCGHQEGGIGRQQQRQNQQQCSDAGSSGHRACPRARFREPRSGSEPLASSPR